MATTGPIEVDLWISDEELAELALNLERIVTRAIPRRASRQWPADGAPRAGTGFFVGPPGLEAE